jgi:hypothetical protein
MKVAICLSGESFDYISIHHWLKENFYSKYDCKTYIHTWDNAGNTNEVLKLFEPKKHYFQSLIPFDDNNEYLNDILNETYSTHACFNLVKEDNFEYDLIIHIKFNYSFSFNEPNFDKFAACSLSTSEHYADCFSFILYYIFIDENYQHQENKVDNEIQNLIRYHLSQNNLLIDSLHTYLE